MSYRVTELGSCMFQFGLPHGLEFGAGGWYACVTPPPPPPHPTFGVDYLPPFDGAYRDPMERQVVRP